MIAQQIRYYCASCHLKMVTTDPSSQSPKEWVYFSPHTRFDSDFNGNPAETKYMAVRCAQCQHLVARLKWEFYSQNFRRNLFTVSENVFIHPNQVFAKPLWSQSDLSRKLGASLRLVGGSL